jgi:hypothetical protein
MKQFITLTKFTAWTDTSLETTQQTGIHTNQNGPLMYLRRVVYVMHLTLEDQPTPYVRRAIAYITDRERGTLGTELEELKWDALERKGGRRE